MTFGLTVARGAHGGWWVRLPHQCDEWDIAGDRHEGEPYDEAVLQLEALVAEARTALENLRMGQETRP